MRAESAQHKRSAHGGHSAAVVRVHPVAEYAEGIAASALPSIAQLEDCLLTAMSVK